MQKTIKKCRESKAWKSAEMQRMQTLKNFRRLQKNTEIAKIVKKPTLAKMQILQRLQS